MFFNKTINEESEVVAGEDTEITVTQEEIEETIKSLKTGKASGSDEIAAEFIKWGGNELQKWLILLFRKSWATNTIPKDWEKNVIVPLYKKGKKTKCENYRAICLASTLYKMYTKIVEKKLRKEVEGKLEEEQAAYNRGKQTQDHISIVRKVIERANEQGKELYLVFVDLKAAFDTVSREKLWSCLEELEVSPKLRKVIKSVYRRVTGEVRIKSVKSSEFEMQRGIKQGDSLSPFLFNIYMDRILKLCKRNMPKVTVGYRNMCPIQLQSLLYADDIILLADSRESTQKILDKWNEIIQQMDMKVNTEKTKIMKTSGLKEQQDIKCGEDKLEYVSTFEYLGTIISEDGKMDTEILSRSKKATQIYYQLNKTIFGKTEISTKTKNQIYNAVAVPTMIYGSETWPLTIKQGSKMTATEMKYLRKIAGKTKRDRCKNNDIRESLKQKALVTIIEEKQLKWYGHVQRMNAGSLTRKVAEARRFGKRKIGRPMKSMEQRMEEIAQGRGKTTAELKGMVGDRNKWKKWVETPQQPTP